MIVATTPYFDEPQDLLDDAIASVPFRHYVYKVELGAPGFPNESSLRRPGLAEAIRLGADWWLQLDADEQLVYGAALVDRIDHLDSIAVAYPLPRLEEDGSVQVCPYKLVRLPVELVVGCDHFRRPGDDRVWRYSLDRSAREEERARLLAGPHLVHQPSRRPRGRSMIRIGELENVAEPRPRHALPLQWPDSSLILQGGGLMAKEAPDGTVVEYEHSDGKYYCPGCGKRYDTPGVCEGSVEAGHGALAVEQVIPSKKSDGGDSPKKKSAKK